MDIVATFSNYPYLEAGTDVCLLISQFLSHNLEDMAYSSTVLVGLDNDEECNPRI